jgi:lipid-A-disaccharide synthase
MAEAGCNLIYPLCNLAVMGFSRVFNHLQTFQRLLLQAERRFHKGRPDAVVLIDYPGFHWWLARVAHKQGIPVFYFVPPQLWAWAGWRVHKMRRWVDHVLCSLPFEENWYRSRGVAARYLGHPYFDELSRQKLNEAFVTDQVERPGVVIALLPGSRRQELELNLTTLLNAATAIHAARPDSRFLVACLKREHQGQAEGCLENYRFPVEVHAGFTPEIIHLAKVCIAVSGSVGLELLYHRKPSVVVYRAHWFPLFLARFMQTCPYISLVNLLANKELLPEFLSYRDQSRNVAERVLFWLNREEAYQETCRELGQLKEGYCSPGACQRAAEYIVEKLARGEGRRAKGKRFKT